MLKSKGKLWKLIKLNFIAEEIMVDAKLWFVGQGMETLRILRTRDKNI